MDKYYLLLLLAASVAAQAEDQSPVYLGLGIGYYHMTGTHRNTEDFFPVAKLGWQVTENTAVEIGTAVFSETWDLNFDQQDLDLEVKTKTLSAVYRYPLNSDRLSLLGQVGAYYWESTLDIENNAIFNSQTNRISQSETDYGKDLFFGLGLQYQHQNEHLHSELFAHYYRWRHTMFDNTEHSHIASITYDLIWRF